MSQKSGKKTGTCRLIREKGPLVKCHILPLALTKPKMGEGFFQLDPQGRRIRRWSSWYDPNLVTMDGEKILADLDNQGILELERHKLIWRSWLGKLEVPEHRALDGHGARIVRGAKTRILRIFFLSLLWRAAESSLFEFDAIRLTSHEKARLRNILTGKEDPPLDFFPCHLVQLSTKGPNQNRSPYVETIDFRIVGGEHLCQVFRFYFDGLIVRFFANVPSKEWLSDVAALMVGCAPDFVVYTISYEQSFQRFGLINEAIRMGPPAGFKI